MKNKSKKLTAGLAAIVISLLVGGLVSSSAFNVNAAESLSDADVSIYKAYNLNTGNGEIGLYSYRNIIL